VKLLAVAITFLGVSSPALSGIDYCRSITSDKERLACFDKEAAVKPECQRQGTTPGKPDQVDLLKEENDKVSKRLQGICRGCDSPGSERLTPKAKK
jgi:hypothetical protein